MKATLVEGSGGDHDIDVDIDIDVVECSWYCYWYSFWRWYWSWYSILIWMFADVYDDDCDEDSAAAADVNSDDNDMTMTITIWRWWRWWRWWWWWWWRPPWGYYLQGSYLQSLQFMLIRFRRLLILSSTAQFLCSGCWDLRVHNWLLNHRQNGHQSMSEQCRNPNHKKPFPGWFFPSSNAQVFRSSGWVSWLRMVHDASPSTPPTQK